MTLFGLLALRVAQLKDDQLNLMLPTALCGDLDRSGWIEVRFGKMRLVFC